jgi:hypothetical protein
MRHLPPLLALGTFAIGAAGCDAQFSSDYTGESLLTIVGNVEITNDRTKGKLIPALAFMNQSRGEVSIQEVAVRGQFPSDFQLDVFEPPPNDAFVNLTRQKSGEPQLAIGYITAVPIDHPDSIRQGTGVTTTVFGTSEEDSDKACGGKGCRITRSEYCIDDDPSVPCYVEDLYCPTHSTPEEECTYEAVSGDPTLKESPWGNFAGFSQNYVVVFLRERAAAGSVTEAILGGTNGVPRGYGLYAMKAPSEAEYAANQDCTARAEVHAAVAWNEEFEANLSTLNFEAVCFPTGLSAMGAPPATPPAPGAPTPIGDLGAPPVDFPAPFCGASSAETDTLDESFEARERLIEASKLELGCAIFDFKFERVKNPADESVSVVIGTQAQPFVLSE